jgi:hypothetical protein
LNKSGLSEKQMVSRLENWRGDVEVNLIMDFDIIYQEKDKIDSGD